MKKTGKSSLNLIRFLALPGLCAILAFGMPHQALATETGELPSSEEAGGAMLNGDAVSSSVSDNQAPGQNQPPQAQTGQSDDGSASGEQAGQSGDGSASGGQAGQSGDGSVSGGQAGNTDGNGSGGQQPSVSQPFSVDASGRITGFQTAWLDQLTPAQRSSLSLTIPSSIDGVKITGIAPDAFAAASYAAAYPELRITKLVLPSDGSLTSIGDRAFYGCSGLKGVLTLPDSLSLVGAGAFGGTGYSTVYLPDREGISYGAGAFAGGSPSAAVICPSEASYHALKQAGIGGSDKALTYQLMLQFQADGKVVVERPVLYNRAISLYRQADGSWANQKDYRLPAIPNQDVGRSYRWVFAPAPDEEVTPRTPVTGKVLTVSSTISSPSITAGEDIEKTYDTYSASLEIKSEHPLYSPAESAEDGDVLFYYTWKWQEDGRAKIREGYDLSSLSFTDAIETRVDVTVQPSVKGSSDSVPGGFHHTFQVNIRQAEPVVKPVLSSDPLIVGGDLPALSLPDDCIPGSIAWDAGQKPEEGEHSYTWTFTPKDEKNYTSVTGSCKLKAQEQTQPACQLTVSAGTNGKYEIKDGSSPDSSGRLPVHEGEKLSFSFLPNPGYTVDRLILDGKDVTGQLRELSYTFHHNAGDSCSEHTLTVSFRKMDSAEMEKILRELPVLKEDSSCSTETANAYLDAKIAYETLEKDRDLKISPSVLQSFYQSMLALPSIHLDMDQSSYTTLSNACWLLEHMSLEEARGLRTGTIQEFRLTVDSGKAALSQEQQKDVLNQKKDARIAVSYNVSIQKTIKEKGAVNNYPLRQLSHPVTLRLSLPADLKGPADDYSRTYYVVGIHEEGNGKASLSLLPARLDTFTSSGAAVSAETSRFSVFSVIYVDQKKENKPSDNQDDDKQDDGGSSGGGGSSSGTYVPDYEKEFWDSVASLIKKAKAGDTVNVNAVTYDKMPEGVMAALRENPNVALIVRWEGGDPVMIPARTALTKDKGRVYYPLSYLSAHYKALNAALTQQKPGNGSASGGNSSGNGSSSGQTTPGSGSSSGSGSSGGSSSGGSSGGSKWDISAPPNKGNSYTPTPEDQGVEQETESQTETPETESESLEEIPSEPESSAQDDLEMQSVTQKGDGESIVTAIVLIVSIVLLVLLAVIFVVLLTIKKRR